MHKNAALIESFYQAFQRRDHAAMARCYGPDIVFRDAVFALDGWRVGAMWRMLCERAADLRVEYHDVRADGTAGSATWSAWYTFSATGRHVHNRIRAAFVLQDGLIVRHSDRFDLHRWAAQALGLKGLLLGWSSPVQRTIRTNAARALESYIRQHGLDAGHDD
jgi:ketosteroid isomerase-like protein